MEENELLTAEKAAEVLGVSRWTLVDWRGKGEGPKWLRVGPRLVRYRRGDLEAFANAGLAQPQAASHAELAGALHRAEVAEREVATLRERLAESETAANEATAANLRAEVGEHMSGQVRTHAEELEQRVAELSALHDCMYAWRVRVTYIDAAGNERRVWVRASKIRTSGDGTMLEIRDPEVPNRLAVVRSARWQQKTRRPRRR